MHSISRPWRRYSIASLLLAVAVTAFFGATLRRGHNWDGDYALYIMQARNIVQGSPYTQTNFIPNPNNPINPALYPAGLPLLLAPLYRAYGVDVDRMKWVGIVAFGLWLLVLAQIARQLLPDAMALTATLLIAVHPYLWNLKDTIFAEFPFLLFAYASLLLTERILAGIGEPRLRVAATAGLAVTLAAAYLTRTVGVVLFPVILGIHWWRTRYWTGPLVAAVCGAGALAMLAQRYWPSDAGTYINYLSQFNLREMLDSALDYELALDDFLDAWLLRLSILQWPVVVAFAALALIGMGRRVRAGVTSYEVFIAGYLLLLFVFPVHTDYDRYLLPVCPLLLCYALSGAGWVGHRIGGDVWRARTAAGLVSGLLCSYALVYWHTDFGDIENSVTAPPSREMFAALAAIVPPDGVVLARKPTIVGLFSGRRSAVWSAPLSEQTFWDDAQALKAHYLVQRLFQQDRDLDALVKADAARLTVVFHNAWFNVYSLPP